MAITTAGDDTTDSEGEAPDGVAMPQLDGSDDVATGDAGEPPAKKVTHSCARRLQAPPS